jgi:hypothetical protein
MSIPDHEIEDDRPQASACLGPELGCDCYNCVAFWRDIEADRRYDERKERDSCKS